MDFFFAWMVGDGMNLCADEWDGTAFVLKRLSKSAVWRMNVNMFVYVKVRNQ